MKKSVLGILTCAALMFSMSSCGEKLLTDEQVQAEIQKGYDAGMPAVQQEMTAKCEEGFEARVSAVVDQARADHEAEMAAEAAANKGKKK